MRTIVCAWAAMLALLTGCASYQARPLRLSEYAHDWLAREIDVAPVRAYAEALGDDVREAPFDLSDGLDLHEAEAIALVFNPQLRLARAQAEVPLASAREAGWWPDPSFEAEVLRFANRGRPERFRLDRGSFDGVNTNIVGAGGLSAAGIEATPPGYRRSGGDFIDDPWIIGGSLSITIPISGRLAVEKDKAWAEYDAAWRQIAIAEWELLTRLRATWLAWSTTRERIDVTLTYIGQIEPIAQTTDRLVAAGELNSTEARVLMLELRRRRTSLPALRAEEAQQRLELHALLGLAPDAPVALSPSVFVSPIGVVPDERQDAVLHSNPRILAAAADYVVAEQRLRLEVRKQYPDLSVGPSYSFEEGFSRLGLGFGMPIPLWNRNRQAVAEATAEREAYRVRAEAEVEAVYSELSRAEARLRFASERRQLLLDDVVPLVDRQIGELRRLLDLGEIDVLVMREALSTSLETKLDLLDATLAEAQAADALQQMVAPRWTTLAKAERAEDKR